MSKWYTQPAVEQTPILSSRVRLARNLKQYPFSVKLDEHTTNEMIREVVTALPSQFRYEGLQTKNKLELRLMLEKHLISLEHCNSKKTRGVLLQEEDDLNIMVNEEDHVRIQSISSGNAMDAAWDKANAIDDILEEQLDYAFDNSFGYLTSCPTNVGTGIRASFMVHLPLLEKTEQLKNIVTELGKFGMTVRGLYGEGSESLGSIYQISNQLTLGKSEEEIIIGLKNFTNPIVEKEQYLWDKASAMESIELADLVYRSYGVLNSCRKISLKEAMVLLSNIRLGYCSGMLKEARPSLTIYNIMMEIQPGAVLARINPDFSREVLDEEKDITRAEIIRQFF